MSIEFKKLFETFGFIVENFGENSFLATNGIITVPYTEFKNYEKPTISGCSLLAPIEDIKKYYSGSKKIGCEVFRDCMQNDLEFPTIGNICNHNHSLSEVECWLKSIS